MKKKVYPITANTRADFFQVHHHNHDCGWCCCVAWWIPTWERWGDRSAAENRNYRQELFDRGIWDGYLLAMDDVPVGWCQCGPRDQWPKLVQQYELQPDPNIWALTCFLVVPSFRKQGLSHFFLDELIRQLSLKGVQQVQAFPKRGHHSDDGEIWTGPETLFITSGFSLIRDHPAYPVYQKKLAS
ncbi:GNAT family N-acetyltransferase [candidate division CSSED10-310 bacterium]|uniref:GNAT family N-acetyltransferase n=1 Tax=candidate division CSSED10-310 bacterium TaxID=2855610 RepID=A0ABV6YSG5_UNCC1